ncbi:hypothetical protein ABI_35560 [Asticcacaulis biprosthecium C19]|uniref:Uncharacterized protein n=2 Tax=Asticcacaulis biprosthecium TaxID=76891 RepID=F4QQP6_9CAUL|nr:hypothetical protein ABI_35560 [Asticcacaulis biprosthecium C19]
MGEIEAAAADRPMVAVMTFFGAAQIHYGRLMEDPEAKAAFKYTLPSLKSAMQAPAAADFMTASALAGEKGKGQEREDAARYLARANDLDALPYGAFRYVTFANLVNETEDAAKWDPSIQAAMPSRADCFWRFIAAAPWTANTYYDLGNTLYGEYDMPKAWRVWDLGRAADPDWKSSLMRGVPQLEARLRRDFPDSF